jgi:PAS domain S-box-containing protein
MEASGHILLRAIADHTPDAVYVKDRDGRVVFANRACLDLIGRPAEQVLHHRDLDFHAQADEVETITSMDRHVLQTGQAFIGEEAFTTPAGERRIFLSTKAPLRDAQGQVTGLIGISTDITDRKRSEEALRLREKRFRAAVAAVNGVLWTADASGGFIDEQPAWAALTGQDHAQYRDFGWIGAVHPDDAEATVQFWLQAVRERRPFHFEHRLRRRDGAWRTCLIRSIPIFDDCGTLIEWVGVHADVTDDRMTRQHLADTIEQLSLALAIGEIGVWHFCAAERRFELDDRMAEMCGLPEPGSYDEDAILGLIAPDQRDAVRATIRAAASGATPEPFDIECRIRRVNDGQTRWLAARGKLVRPSQDDRPSLIGTSRDVTVRREREIQVSALLRENTHRTKNTLAVVQAIARQASASATEIGAFREGLDARLQSLSRSLDLLVDREWRGVSLRALIEAQLDGGMDRVTLDGPDLAMRADAVQNLGLVLHELSANAKQHGALMAVGGRITLSWRIVEGAEPGRASFVLRWQEQGGPAVNPPSRRGFGRTLMQRVFPGGRSELQFKPEGVVWEVEAPADQVILVDG